MRQPTFAWIEEELDSLAERELLRDPSVRSGPQGATLVWNGQTLINFGSNDYLGLAAELGPYPTVQSASDVPASSPDSVPVVRSSPHADLDPQSPLDGAQPSRPSPPLEVDEKSRREDGTPLRGWGSGASPIICGRGWEQAQLELEIAAFEEAPAALLFSSGYAANVGVLTALLGKEDVVFSDAKNHASIIDGCRLSGARIVVYPHRDLAALRLTLRETRSFRRRLIVTDSLFSMDGDFAPLTELAELAESEDAMLVVDEAHATGVFGPQGRGLCEQFGVEAGCPVRVGTLSKALGSSGGFVVGPSPVIRWLTQRARPYFFSTAPPDAVAAASRIALCRVRSEPHRRQQLLAQAAWLRNELTRQGWNVGDSQSQIIPIILGDARRTMQFMAHLQQYGLFIPGIRPPSVPAGESLLRISLSYRHTSAHLEQMLTVLDQLKHGPF